MVLQSLSERVKALGSRVSGTPLETELKRATQLNSIDVPEDAVLFLMQASHNVDDRRQIMLHIHRCLMASSSAEWRRVYSAIVLLEALLERGSPKVVSEVANGMHCDLSQRLSFLESYEYSFDMRVQDMIRRRAKSLRVAWLERQVTLMLAGCNDDDHEDDNNTSDDGRSKKPTVKACLQGSSKNANPQDDSTTDGESSRSPDPSPRLQSTPSRSEGEATLGDLLAWEAPGTVPTPSPEVDLLGGDFGAFAPSADVALPQVSGMDLLGFNDATAPSQGVTTLNDAKGADVQAALAPSVDWLDVAKSHGLYAQGAPGSGDLSRAGAGSQPASAHHAGHADRTVRTAAGPAVRAAHKEFDLLLDL